MGRSAQHGMIGLTLLAGTLALIPDRDPDHAGPARVIDGDTIVVHGTKHRMLGIDAVECDQTCTTHQGRPWPCGREAARALREFLNGRKVNCLPRGRRDRYGRHLSICHAGPHNLSAWMAREGWAVADPSAPRFLNFARDVGMARLQRKGIWSGRFDDPADWRQAHR